MFLIQSASKRYGGQVLLDGADWAAPHRGVVGLVGPNGAGKTTLLRMLVGEEEIDSGRIAVPAQTTLGYLPQELAEAESSGSVEDVLLAGRQELVDLEREIDAARRELEANEETDTARVAEHSEMFEEFERLGGYTFRAEARQIAAGLGFSEDDFDRPITTFSGGWQMRALLGQLLLRRPDVLLLDEPTNHLDTETIEWLESFMGRYEGLVVVVSHDRYFLNRMASTIVELQSGRLTSYPGNFDAYRDRKAEEMERAASAANRQAKEVERVRDFIERFRYKSTKAKQVQSRVKALEKLQRVDIPTDEVRAIEFRFPQPERAPKIVVEISEVAKSFDDVHVWKSLDLTITRGEKIALMGPNGAGKTTLLRVLAGRLDVDSGEVRIPERVAVSYFAQHAVDQLDPTTTVYKELMREADTDTSKRVRSILGAFGFSGEEVDKPISVLSGGEKNRVALAKMMLAPAALLLLDEPTNHLDIESRQVLEFALRDFEGTFIVVSHDRYFVNEVADRVVHLEDGRATSFLGDYEYYRWKMAEEREANQPEPDESETRGGSKKEARRAAAEFRAKKKEATKTLRAEITKVERRIEELETSVAEAERSLLDPAVHADPDALKKWSQQHREANDQLEVTMENWERLSQELEEIERELEEGRGEA